MRRCLLASSVTLALAGFGWLAVRLAQRNADRRFWRHEALDYGIHS